MLNRPTNDKADGERSGLLVSWHLDDFGAERVCQPRAEIAEDENRKAVDEIYRVIVEGGVVELRHFYNSANHPHAWACRVIHGERTQSTISWGNQKLEETLFPSVKKSAPRPSQH